MALTRNPSPTAVRGRWLPQLVYDRLGPRIVPGIVAVWVILGLGVLAVGYAALVLGYLNGSSGQFWFGVAITTSVAVAGLVVGVGMGSRDLRRALRQLEAGGDSVAAKRAWVAAVLWPARAMAFSGVVILCLTLPAELLYLIPEFGLEGWEISGVVIADVTGVAFLCGLAVFVGELFVRPLVADLAVSLPPDFEAPSTHWNVRTKLMASLPATALFTLGVAGAWVPDSAPPTARLAAAAATGVAVLMLLAMPATVVATDTILEPLRKLRDATARVSRGDYSTPITITTADEFGEVITSFNRLQGRIGEQLDELRASRARIVSASDAERRRVERNLHDGAQQHLVALSLQLSLLEDSAVDDATRAVARRAREDLSAALSELRDLARGLHPQVLSTGGLAPALKQLAERSPVPVTLRAPAERYPDPVESTAYFVASEALANAAKYSEASHAEVAAEHSNGRLVVSISDDGVGGAKASPGSGLAGLVDRVAALDGQLSVASAPGTGTVVTVELPLKEAGSDTAQG